MPVDAILLVGAPVHVKHGKVAQNAAFSKSFE